MIVLVIVIVFKTFIGFTASSIPRVLVIHFYLFINSILSVDLKSHLFFVL